MGFVLLGIVVVVVTLVVDRVFTLGRHPIPHAACDRTVKVKYRHVGKLAPMPYPLDDEPEHSIWDNPQRD